MPNQSPIRRSQTMPSLLTAAANGSHNGHALTPTARPADGFDGDAGKAPGKVATAMGPFIASPKGYGAPRATVTYLVAPDKVETEQTPARPATLADYKWFIAGGVITVAGVVALSLLVPPFLALLVSAAPVILILAGLVVLTALAQRIARGFTKAIAYLRPTAPAIRPAGPQPSSRNDKVTGA